MSSDNFGLQELVMVKLDLSNVNMHMEHPGGAQKGVKIKLIPIHSNWFYKEQCKIFTGMFLIFLKNLASFCSLFYMTLKVLVPYFFILPTSEKQKNYPYQH